MPTFRPPLYHTSEVITADSTSTPYARLTFSVTPDNDQGVDGVYQLWTDLPNLDAQGSPQCSPGEWHEINFVAVPTPSPRPASSAGISLNPILPPPTSSALYAIIHVPATPATYSYTLRQAKASGEIVWLGSDGSNGTVVVKQGEMSEEAVVESGPWDGTSKSMEGIEWRGVALAMDYYDYFSTPSIVQPPTSESFKASLILALGIRPIDSLPFYHSASDISAPSSSIARNVALAVASAAKKSLDVPAGSILPDKSRQGTFGRSESGQLTSAILKALKEQSEPTFKLVESGESHVLLAPTKAERTTNADLVLLAYSAEQARAVSIKAPAQLDSTSPILAQVAASRQVLRSAGSVDLNLGSGLSAEVVRFTEMSELRAAGGEGSIWICAPSARSVQVGEEEVGEITSEAVAAEADDVEIIGDEPTADALNGDAHRTPEVSKSSLAPGPASEADTEATQQRSVAESEYEAGDEDDSAVTSKPAKMESFWLLRMLDSFLVRIWSWIFQSSQAPALPRREERRITDGDAQEGTDAENAEAPVPNEHTPLLTTPGLSRSTSSTFNSPLASPEAPLNVKATQTLDSLTKRLTDDEATTPKQAERAQYYPAGSVAIRSYTQFTFASSPPFTFFLPCSDRESSTEGWQDKLRFSCKTQTATEWAAAEVELKGEEGGAVEVCVGQGQKADEGGVWEVQVERL